MTSPKERPILFNETMVKAILNGKKTQTRRIVKPQPNIVHSIYDDASISTNLIFRRTDQRIHCPLGKPGDRLWVKETFQYAPQKRCYCSQGASPVPCDEWVSGLGCRTQSDSIIYRAELDSAGYSQLGTWHGGMPWRPSIHMPRWASRITLEINEVKVEKLQDITENDAIAEGTPSITHFNNLWDILYIEKGYGWRTNPWVWAINFKMTKDITP